MINDIQNIIIIYHGNCIDGFTSAWLAYRNLNKFFDDDVNIELYKAYYGGLLPDLTGKHVYMVDFSITPEKMIEVIDLAETITVIDHHKAAFELLEPLSVKYDNLLLYCRDGISGAKLTYEFFNNSSLSAEGERLLNLINDYDLWEKKYEETDYVNTYLESINKTIEDWDKLFTSPLPYMIETGKLMYNTKKKILERHIKNTLHYIDFDDIVLPVVNVDSSLANMACEILYGIDNDHTIKGASATYYITKNKKVKFSIRSKETNEKTVDVNKIARRFNGGGHKCSAGFIVDLDFLNRIVC
jgi:oligoribonuclease NrnB/cAMP/cGMP phosphodiesterase (DHH superfamily)